MQSLAEITAIRNFSAQDKWDERVRRGSRMVAPKTRKILSNTEREAAKKYLPTVPQAPSLNINIFTARIWSGEDLIWESLKGHDIGHLRTIAKCIAHQFHIPNVEIDIRVWRVL